MENKEFQDRVEKRPGAIFSVVAFALVFFVCYLFYPYISMYIPFTGTNITLGQAQTPLSLNQLCNRADTIVRVKVESKDRAELVGNNTVVRKVTAGVNEVLKGQEQQQIVFYEYGGSVLAKSSTGKRKYNVTYIDAADLKTGSEYILFFSNNEIINGKYGVLTFSGEIYSDARGNAYSLNMLKEALK